MKAVIAHRDGSPRVVELDTPPLGSETVLIRVSHAGLMLPDELRVIPRAPHLLAEGQDGIPLGMMVSGIVDEVGEKVNGLKQGLRVTAFGSPYVYHASHLSVPASLVVELPKKVNHEEGAFAGMGARALHWYRESGASIGDTVVVFGGGMSGILTAQLCRAGSSVPILLDPHEHRLTRARNVGVTNAFKPGDDAIVRELDDLTGGHGADTAIVTPDAPPRAVEWAQMLLRWRGTLVLTAPEGQDIDPQLLVEKELRIRAVNTAGPGHRDSGWERRGSGYPRGYVRWTLRENMMVFLQLLADRRVQISPLIGERMPMDRAATLYDKIARSQESVIGAVMTV